MKKYIFILLISLIFVLPLVSVAQTGIHVSWEEWEKVEYVLKCLDYKTEKCSQSSDDCIRNICDVKYMKITRDVNGRVFSRETSQPAYDNCRIECGKPCNYLFRECKNDYAQGDISPEIENDFSPWVGTASIPDNTLARYCIHESCDNTELSKRSDCMKSTGTVYVNCNSKYKDAVVDEPAAKSKPTANCVDGIKNQGEEGVDCGGPCPACQKEEVGACNNGKLDANEEDVDCGGICPACQKEEENTCNNGKLDSNEEGIDCGGICPSTCDYLVTVTPSDLIMFADGKSSQLFNVGVKINNNPARNVKYKVVLKEIFGYNVFSEPGKLSVNEIITDADGKAEFMYYTPIPPSQYFQETKLEIILSGPRGKGINILLKDPRPKISIKLDKRSILEGTEINFVDVLIDDPNSNRWDVEVNTNLGYLIPPIGNTVKLYTLKDKIDKKKYNFNWHPPESTMEIIESYIVLVKDQKNDFSNYKSSLKDAGTELFEETIMPDIMYLMDDDKTNDVKVTEKGKEYYDEIMSYVEQYETWKGNVGEMQRDLNEFKTSTGYYEKFLRSLSFGVEGLQVFYGTKAFMEEKLGKEGKSSAFKKFIEDVRDGTINYGCDSLQTGLRVYAATLREASMYSTSIPVHINVKVTDEEGFTAAKDAMFRYTYFFAPEGLG